LRNGAKKTMCGRCAVEKKGRKTLWGRGQVPLGFLAGGGCFFSGGNSTRSAWGKTKGTDPIKNLGRPEIQKLAVWGATAMIKGETTKKIHARDGNAKESGAPASLWNKKRKVKTHKGNAWTKKFKTIET